MVDIHCRLVPGFYNVRQSTCRAVPMNTISLAAINNRIAVTLLTLHEASQVDPTVAIPVSP